MMVQRDQLGGERETEGTVGNERCVVMMQKECMMGYRKVCGVQNQE